MDRKAFFIIAIATLITVIAWVIFDIMHAKANVEISPKVRDIIEPINPDFGTEVINSL